MTRKKILLVGFFGWGNFGDELFLETHRQQLGEDYELIVANDLTKAPYFSRPVAEIVSEVDAVLIGGGDLINPVNVSGLYWCEEFLEKPVFVFGIGVPNTRRQKDSTIAYYRSFMQHENCKLVVARDVESYNWLESNLGLGDKLTWHPDPVCSYKRPAKRKSHEKTLGVVMREHRSLSQDMSPVQRLIEEARRMDYKVKHIVLANQELGRADYERAKIIASEGDEIVYTEDLNEMCAEISSLSALASIKFHGMIVAAMYGVPTIAMSVTPKNRNFLKMIDRSEMLQSYTHPELYKRLSWYPARISPQTRYWLLRGSRAGYELLKNEIAKAIA
ncbi:polysaccharide pyruvyl transferase family protein [Corynebacterium sp.]|uniref:polysaccharide pyruvyl transferase family protein n=1 Tax=Corynebacterium sp. TaxID=1720 RepID=UPI0026DCD92D|nr:polysaccharide pyruvyl transferase family protein [Corynebacterium sp.]MDO5031013.1 polysaccharide pyruvyl transferase family protein [Corynebacterium sp.]